MTDESLFRVLFLCTGNSARSILAEALLNRLGEGRFRAFSAGSHPTGTVNPCALTLLTERGHDIDSLRSCSWDEFATTRFDLVVTVCDNAAAETCPVWPDNPPTLHWSLPDPAAITGDEQAIRAAFEHTFEKLSSLLEQLVRLPVERLDRDSLERQLKEISP
ncbi:MAG: arsenate reductase ArsC [Pseudomonadales bacterium]|nr:arsenate reductase ArsC [Pseudomonadales bacterium]